MLELKIPEVQVLFAIDRALSFAAGDSPHRPQESSIRLRFAGKIQITWEYHRILKAARLSTSKWTFSFVSFSVEET